MAKEPDTHIVVWPLGEPEPKRPGFSGIETIGEELLPHVKVTETVREEDLCPKCRAGLAAFRAKYGYRYCSRYYKIRFVAEPAHRPALHPIPQRA